jgi:hypothetical protein
MLPPISEIHRDATHRLIPAKYTDRDESVLTRLAGDVTDLSALFELEGATNDRLLGEAGALPGIGVRELVFGVPYSHIVNAAFTHPRPGGSRFNGEDRGAWYAAFARQTSQVEVAYHRSKELIEIDWREKEIFEYVDFLADLRSELYDIRNDTRFKSSLNPDSYRASQRLAEDLLDRGAAGVIYPSVRHRGGTCIACFRPALVAHVRKGATISIVFENAGAAAKFREVQK